jgi:hypothetical protein
MTQGGRSMTKNLGKLDRLVRIAIGIGIGLFGLVFGSWWGLVGIIPLATAGMGSCPLYLPFGISTRRKA